MHSDPSTSGLSIGMLMIGFAALFIVYNVYRAVYNLYFHPLAKFPGPASRAAFDAPHYWTFLKGSGHRVIKDLHDKYGDVVRVRPDALTFNKPEAWRDIYGSRPGKGQLRKDPEFYTVTGDEPTSIIYSNDADHTRMRKLLSHAFSDAALREQEPLLTKYFQQLVYKLSQKADAAETVDISKWYNFLSFDIIGDLCFGESFGALEKVEYHFWMNNLFTGIKFARFIKIASAYPPLFQILGFLTKVIPRIEEARKEHEQFTKLKMAKRLEAKTERKDFMTYILRYNDSRGMSRSELMETASILIIAGSETTSTLLSGATYLLLTNPHTYERAKAEVRAAFESNEDITLASTARLPYLHAVLEESLRKYPPVPLNISRRTGPEGDYIAGIYVPANTAVSVPQWTAYQSTKHWHQPDTFAPERWFENEDVPAHYRNDRREMMNPFSVGPRNCIGKNLAYSEMRSVLARMLWHFDLDLLPESQHWNQQNVFFMWDKPPLLVKLRKRTGL